MKKLIFLFSIIGMFISSSSWAHSAENIKNQYILQNESSILGVQKNRLLLNSEHLSFSQGSILLNMDVCGLVYLDEVQYDGESYYYEGTELAFGMGYLYICNGCGAMYSKDPKTCRVCGGTDFFISDLYPDDRKSS